ncbi:MAG: hypothetical protein ABW199_12260, partial [Caulobacterales bacterium]
YGRPLPPGERYRIVKTELAHGFMDPLRTEGRDTLSIFGLDEAPRCQRASIALFVPRDFRKLKVEDDLDRLEFVVSPTVETALPAHLAEATLTHYYRVSQNPGPHRAIALSFTVC